MNIEDAFAVRIASSRQDRKQASRSVEARVGPVGDAYSVNIVDAPKVDLNELIVSETRVEEERIGLVDVSCIARLAIAAAQNISPSCSNISGLIRSTLGLTGQNCRLLGQRVKAAKDEIALIGRYACGLCGLG